MILAWDNLLDLAVLTAGSELGTLPGSNVQHPHLSRKWFTAAGVNSSSLTLDISALPAARRAARILGVFGSNLTSTATYRVRASDVDPAALATLLLDTTVLAGGVKDGYGAIYKTFTLTNAKYWRIDLADAGVSQLQVGRAFLGPCFIHPQTLLYGWSVTPEDASPIMRSRGGQSYPDVLPQRRVLDATLDFLSETEMYSNVFVAMRTAGRVRDLLMIPVESSAFLSEQSVWGMVASSAPLIHRQSQVFQFKFRVEERL